MKILGGELKGRNIIVPREVRPVSQIVKRACFDILRGEIEGKRVLDFFSGSGSLGIEALSWGAKEAWFVDSEKNCITTIKKSLFSLKTGLKSKVYLKDAFSAIKDFFTYKEVFNVIFLDPPYYKEMLIKALQLLEEYDILAPSGYIVAFCYVKDDFLGKSKIFSLIVERKYGQTLLLIYRKNEESYLSRDI